MMKICFFGPSGSGKSSATKFLKEDFERRGLTTEVLKLAEPLYKVQKLLYTESGITIKKYNQNQKLLEGIATSMRDINPRSIIDNFMLRLKKVNSDVVINDDLRDFEIDMPVLKQNGFILIRIWASGEVIQSRLSLRNDLYTKENSELDKVIERIEPDFVLKNDCQDMQVLKSKISKMVEEIFFTKGE